MATFLPITNPANKPETRRYIRAVLRAGGVVGVGALEIDAALDILAVLYLRDEAPSMQEFAELMAPGEVAVEVEAPPRDPERSLEALMKGM